MLLKNNAIAQAEVATSTNFWVLNGKLSMLLSRSFLHKTKWQMITSFIQGCFLCFLDHNTTAISGVTCMSLNKITEKTESLSCNTELPIICINSAPRRTLSAQETIRQVAVKTAVGTIQGFRDQNSFRFLGIHYAEAPVAERRFAAPVAKLPFESTLDATAFGYVCPQPTMISPSIDLMINGAQADEDCLNLNVFTPSLKSKTEKGLPVMVYIHGGGYTT